LIRFSNIVKRVLVSATIITALTYVLFFSPSLGNFETKTQAQNLNITSIVMQYVNRYYVNLGRLERIVDEVLIDFPNGEEGNVVEVQVFNEKQNFDMGNVQDLNDVANKLDEIFAFVTPNLKSNDIEINDVEYAVLDEMLKTLDAHSGIITPQVYKEFMIETEGSFGGLGIVIGV